MAPRRPRPAAAAARGGHRAGTPSPHSPWRPNRGRRWWRQPRPRLSPPAAALVDSGADTHEINQRVFESVSPTRARLLSRVFGDFHLDAGGRLAWIALSSDLLEEAGAEPEDVEGVVEALRSLEHVEMAILFKEIEKGATKISLRSLGDVDVAELAGRFGGGGHKNAAGAFVRQPMGSVVEEVLAAAREFFEVQRVG